MIDQAALAPTAELETALAKQEGGTVPWPLLVEDASMIALCKLFQQNRVRRCHRILHRG